MRLNLFITFLIIFLLTSACGKKSSSSKRETRIDEQQIEEVMDNQKLECASLGGQCPAGITRLLTVNRADPNSSSVCSGFMVSKNRLITNHHCVATADQCANTYLAIYNGSNYVRTRCQSIIKTEQDVQDPNDPTRKIDYSIIEVADDYSGEFFRLSGTQSSPGDIIQSWVIDHTGLDSIPSNLTDSRITEFSCRVMNQSERDSMVMMKCPVISGNSGSPALNNNGEVIGVIWGGSALSINSSYDLDLRRQLDEIALATDVIYFREFLTR
jgi:V8-like Glu-specific endopeptidase